MNNKFIYELFYAFGIHFYHGSFTHSDLLVSIRTFGDFRVVELSYLFCPVYIMYMVQFCDQGPSVRLVESNIT